MVRWNAAIAYIDGNVMEASKFVYKKMSYDDEYIRGVQNVSRRMVNVNSLMMINLNAINSECKQQYKNSGGRRYYAWGISIMTSGFR